MAWPFFGQLNVRTYLTRRSVVLYHVRSGVVSTELSSSCSRHTLVVPLSLVRSRREFSRPSRHRGSPAPSPSTLQITTLPICSIRRHSLPHQRAIRLCRPVFKRRQCATFLTYLPRRHTFPHFVSHVHSSHILAHGCPTTQWRAASTDCPPSLLEEALFSFELLPLPSQNVAPAPTQGEVASHTYAIAKTANTPP